MVTIDELMSKWWVLQGKKISCPTCRACTRVADVAYVDNGRGGSQGSDGATDSGSAAQEAAIQVEGSYGTKVCDLLSNFASSSRLAVAAKAARSARIDQREPAKVCFAGRWTLQTV